MNCTKRQAGPLLKPSLFALSACLLATTSACGVAPATGAEEEVTSRAATEDESSKHIAIFVSDNRTLSNVTVTFDGFHGDPTEGGPEYSDWEAVGGSLPGTQSTMKYQSGMALFDTPSNALQEWIYAPGYFDSNYHYSTISILPAFWSAPNFWFVRMTVRAYIDGYCHEDYQDIRPRWSGDAYLYFNGNGASWDGSCYRGDLLRTTP